MKAAFLFDCFGPYHLARLGAASRVVELLGLESAARSREYGWVRRAQRSGPTMGKSGGDASFRQVTLSGCSRRLAAWPWAWWRLRAELQRFQPYSVFLPGWSKGMSLATLVWCRSNGVPAVMMSESGFADAPRVAGKEAFKSWILERCSAALVGGSAHREYLARLGVRDERIFEGYDVVDNDYFRRNAQSVRLRASEARAQLTLPGRYFLASARFIPRKNLVALLVAYAKYRAAASPPVWNLVILGDGPQRSRIERKICELRLEGSVQLRGFIQYPELPAYYALATAFILPSLSEPWGLVVNEAMASSLPVLVSNRCGCAQDLVTQGANGFAFDPANPDELTDLMLRLDKSEGELGKMSSAAAKKIEDWGLDKFCSGVLGAARTARKDAALRRPN